MKFYYLSPNKMDNSIKLIFWCLFMVAPLLGLNQRYILTGCCEDLYVSLFIWYDNGEMVKCSWSDSQSSSRDYVYVFMFRIIQ